MNEYDKKINEGKFLLTDLVQGEESVAKRNDFEDLTYEEIRKSIKLILGDNNLSDSKKQYMLSNMWKIHYRQKPPTMDDFLKPEWLGPTSSNVYPHVRSVLNKFWSPDAYERNLLLAPCIGWGKSLCTAVSILYIMVHMNILRDPKQFFGLSEASSIVAVLGSFTIAKAKQTLLRPFTNILRSSPKFRKVQNEDRVEITQEEENNDRSNRIVWTTASRMEGAIQFSNDLHILIVSDFASLLGLSIITGALSEISFFMDKGVSIDEIDRTYNDLKGRVVSRFGYRYFATTIIDSSPNDFSSPIDKYIFSGEAERDPRNLVITSTHWEAFKDLKPELYQEWIKTGETFPVFRGNGSRPGLIISKDQVKEYSPAEIFNVPIDLYSLFHKDLKKSIKDYAGFPSGSESKLIDDFDYIEKIFKNKQLKNIYNYIKCQASKNPEGLIWNQINKQFFIQLGPKQFEFYRAPYEKRWIAIDLSEIGDIASISCVHPELDKYGQIIIVADFTIAIVPDKERINLLAIEKFIIDLKYIGRMNIVSISYDRYQSSSSIQNLKRENFEKVGLFSVDLDTSPYYVFTSWIMNERIKAGRNIFLKNNLKSIQEVKLDSGKKKVDHLIGKVVYDDGGDWNLSLMGFNGKDVSDSFCSAAFQCINEFQGTPRYQYEEDEKELNSEFLKNKILNKIHNKYSFKLRETI